MSVACIEGGVPLFIFFAKANDNDVSVFDRFAGAHRIEIGAFAIVPKFVRFFAHNSCPAVVGRGMISYGGSEGDIEVLGGACGDDFFAPTGVDFTCKVNVQFHVKDHLPFSSTQPIVVLLLTAHWTRSLKLSLFSALQHLNFASAASTRLSWIASYLAAVFANFR